MQAFSIEELRQAAKRRLPRAVFDFIDGGAEDEVTLRANLAAFENVQLLPRVLVDVSRIDTETQILGKASKLPIIIAPTGAVGFGWRGGDLAIARAAAALGIPYSLSMNATASIERIAREAPGRLWFQAYFLKQRDTTFGLIERARAAGYEALIVTADVPVGGKRERDYRNDFSLPFKYTARNLLDFASRPAWALPMLFQGIPVMENL
ncbi:MAG: alpha-hydroxy acid oxidase, partial [Terriglobales bacterium]